MHTQQLFSNDHRLFGLLYLRNILLQVPLIQPHVMMVSVRLRGGEERKRDLNGRSTRHTHAAMLVSQSEGEVIRASFLPGATVAVEELEEKNNKNQNGRRLRSCIERKTRRETDRQTLESKFVAWHGSQRSMIIISSVFSLTNTLLTKGEEVAFEKKSIVADRRWNNRTNFQSRQKVG